MVHAAREAGVVLAVGHCMAWAPPIVAAQQLIDAGRIGRPVLATISASFDSPPAGTWRQETTTEAGGGPLQDLGSHAVDALLRLLGPAVRVQGMVGRVRYEYPADDTATLLVQFASGAQAVVQTAFTCTQNDLVIHGTEGRLTSRQWLGREFAGSLSWEPSGVGIGRFDKSQVIDGGQSIELARVNVYRPQVDEVSRSILEGSPLRIDGERELAVVAVLEAGIESARRGRSVELKESNQ